MKTAALLALALALPVFADSPLLEQGKAALNRGDAGTAAGLLERAVAQTPNSAEAHYQLGGAYGTMAQTASFFQKPGLAKKSLAELERAVQLDPNHREARFALVQFYTMAPGIMGGSNEKAAEQISELKKRDALFGHRAQAWIYARDKKTDLARKEYSDAVKEQPSSPKPHYWLGLYLMATEKNYKGASDEFETAIKLDPTFMPGWYMVGRNAATSGVNLPHGEEALHKYLTYTPKEDEPQLARAHYWLGQIYEKQGKKAEAKQSYGASLKLNPSQKDVQEAMKRVS